MIYNLYIPCVLSITRFDVAFDQNLPNKYYNIHYMI